MTWQAVPPCWADIFCKGRAAEVTDWLTQQKYSGTSCPVTPQKPTEKALIFFLKRVVLLRRGQGGWQAAPVGLVDAPRS